MNWKARFVQMIMMRRSLCGAFLDCNSRVVQAHRNTNDNDLWDQTMKLLTGAYRCGMLSEDVKIASTCVQIHERLIKGAGQSERIVMLADRNGRTKRCNGREFQYWR